MEITLLAHPHTCSCFFQFPISIVVCVGHFQTLTHSQIWAKDFCGFDNQQLRPSFVWNWFCHWMRCKRVPPAIMPLATSGLAWGVSPFLGPWEKDIPFVGHISVYIYKMPHPMWTHTYLEEEWVQDGAIRLVVRFWRLKRSTRSLETELQNTEFICHVVFHLFQTTASQTKAWNLKHLETNLLRQHPNVYYSVRLTKRKAYNIA